MSNKPSVNIFWFRRDLRLEDNAGLFYALKSGKPVLPLFIYDTNILSHIENKRDTRVEFIYNSLNEIQLSLQENGSSLVTEHGTPIDVFKKMLQKYEVGSVFTNHDYEPYAMDRDEKVAALLLEHGISFIDFKDQVIFEKNEIVKDDGKPYTTFTSYCNKWKKKLQEIDFKKYRTEALLNNFFKFMNDRVLSLKDIGFQETGIIFPPKKFNKEITGNYGSYRDFPFREATSRLGVHLRFGTISIRDIAAKALNHSEAWLNELVWREFFMMILYHFPYVLERSFKQEFDNIRWRNDEREFGLWCSGKTGYPLIDAGMRELKQTGYMHNRVRMTAASFLVKNLLIDWRWGERFFADNLLDYELASNNGNWQWIAGTGADASPYFRVFNPVTQQQKFDPDFEYIRKWIPEFGTSAYPEPVVDLNYSRERAIEAYKSVLSRFKNTMVA
ncbi:MAG: cryptochrome/photolyase family protein [Ignavibacteria bacterium]